MIDGTDIKKELTRLLRSRFDYKIHGKEVVEGYKKPSFFLDLRLVDQEDAGINIVSKRFHCEIVYFQKRIDEADMLSVTSSITELLTLRHPRSKKKKMLIKIDDRFIPVTGFEQGFTGKNNNILTIDFEVEFFDFSTEKETDEVMRHVYLNKELEG